MMKLLLMVAALVGGIALSVKLTKWANWFAFGENRERREREMRGKRDSKPEDGSTGVRPTGV